MSEGNGQSVPLRSPRGIAVRFSPVAGMALALLPFLAACGGTPANVGSGAQRPKHACGPPPARYIMRRMLATVEGSSGIHVTSTAREATSSRNRLDDVATIEAHGAISLPDHVLYGVTITRIEDIHPPHAPESGRTEIVIVGRRGGKRVDSGRWQCGRAPVHFGFLSYLPLLATNRRVEILSERVVGAATVARIRVWHVHIHYRDQRAGLTVFDERHMLDEYIAQTTFRLIQEVNHGSFHVHTNTIGTPLNEGPVYIDTGLQVLRLSQYGERPQVLLPAACRQGQ